MSERMNFVESNFVDDKTKKLVPWIKFGDTKLPGIGRGFGDKAGCNPESLLRILQAGNVDEIIALCEAAVAQCELHNAKVAPKATAKAAPAASATVYYTSDGSGVVSAPIIDVAQVRAFALANAANPGAAIHCNGVWHVPSQWASIGFAPPPAPPAPPVAPLAPVAPPAPSAPVAPTAPAAPVATRNASALEKIVQQRQLATA